MSDKQSTINAIWDQADRDADAANREVDEFIKSIDVQEALFRGWINSCHLLVCATSAGSSSLCSR